MDTGQKLPARMYRLAYDLDKDKPSGRAWLDYLVQGAALTELLAEGLLIDTGVKVIPAVEGPGDEVLGLVWQQARMTAPTHACVVPSRRGRPGPHPLYVLLGEFLALPWTVLRIGPGADPLARTLDPDRFHALRPLTGASVLLLDDTWTSGGTAQSAAVALKRAGARSVAAVVLGRHVAAGAATGLPPGRRSIG